MYSVIKIQTLLGVWGFNKSPANDCKSEPTLPRPPKEPSPPPSWNNGCCGWGGGGGGWYCCCCGGWPWWGYNGY